MRRILARVLKIVVIVFVAVVVLALGAGYWFITRSQPQTTGTLQIAGLKSRVEVIRDQMGVPQIYADNADDLFFAQGYIHTQDRLWQMELNRHIGHGQLAELFGDVPFGDSTTVKVDAFLRTIGLDRAARVDWNNLDAATREYLQKYADGVNAYLHSRQDNLPLEFVLIGDHPADWQPLDTIVWGKVMAYDLSGNYDSELLRANLLDTLGQGGLNALIPTYPANGPFIIPPDVKSYASLTRSSAPAQPLQEDGARAIGHPDLGALAAINGSLRPLADGLGSDNWVVDGTRTTTSKPLLANDPHLGIQMPAIWYTNGLHCAPVSANCPFDVVGYTFPAVPGVVIGHNQRIAWGVTNTGPDVQDLFIEKVNPANPNQYEYQGQWQDMQIDSQVIHVKDGADVPLTIQITRHGPIMTPVLKGVTATLALEWTATNQPGTLVQSLVALDRAQNWDDFRNALRLWDVPAQNFVYADVDGNIGYQMPGRVPIRAKGDGTLPVPGWTGEYEWTGYIPFDQLPFVLNPPSHYVATANNPVVPNDYKYLIAREWAAPFREQRIEDLILAKDKLSADDFKAMQSDVYSIPLTRMQKYVAALKPSGFLGQRAMQYVQQWDGRLTQDNIGGTILEVTYLQLVRDLLGARLEGDLYKSYLGAGDWHRLLVYQMLEDPTNALWNDPGTAQQETRDDRLAKAYAEGVDWLGSQFGDWPPDWHWGRLHTATFAHPFGSEKPLNLLFNFGPVAVPGDGYTLFNTGFDDTDPYQVGALSSMREIIDLSNFDHSWWIHTTGESGQPLDKHYTDLTNMWRNAQYAPLSFTRAAVEQGKAQDLVLTP